MFGKYLVICFLYYFTVIVSIFGNIVVAKGLKISNERSENFDIRQYFNSKSPYQYQYRENVEQNLNGHLGQGCTPVSVWMMSRHGSRNPGAKMCKKIHKKVPKFLKEILEAHKNGKGQLSETVVKDLNSWTIAPHYDPLREKFLTPIGESELFQMGSRYKERFPSIFQKPFSDKIFQISYTETQRCEQSAMYFFKGIFNQMGSSMENVFSGMKLSNGQEVIRVYTNCTKWQEQVKNNASTTYELGKFEKSQIVLEMLVKIQSRLGLEKPLSFTLLEIVYNTCIFDFINIPKSPWCSVFDENDLRILNYHQDIKYYWLSGYGYDINTQLGCPMIKDFMKYFTKKIENPEDPLENISYFTHSGTILKFLATLGLFKDSEPLGAGNFDKFLYSRKWRTSSIDTMASNIAFTLFNCTGEYKVGTYFQENPIHLPACPDQWLCSFDQIKSHFSDLVQNCDIDKIC